MVSGDTWPGERDRIAVEQYNQNRFLSVQTILLPCSQDSAFQCCAATGDKNTSRCFLSNYEKILFYALNDSYRP